MMRGLPVPVGLCLLLCACRVEPGRCSQDQSKLCIEAHLEGVAQIPDTLHVEADSDTMPAGMLRQDVRTGVTEAFRDRQRFVLEIDTQPIPAADRIHVSLTALKGGATLATGEDLLRRGDKARPAIITLHPPGGGGEDLRGADLNGADLRPGPDLGTGGDMRAPWPSGQAASATLGGGGVLKNPTDVCWTGARLYVADTGNHRVLVFPSLEDGVAPVVAVGRPDLTTVGVAPAASARTMNSPRGLYCDTSLLLVADSGNNRVMVFSTAPGTNAPMDGVVGQTDFVSGSINRGGGASATARSLSNPRDVFWDTERLYIADKDNQRVVAYGAPSRAVLTSLNATDAVAVLGQQALNTSAPATSAGGLSAPEGVFGVSSRLAVADTNNNRVTVYTKPGGLTAPADAALGQMDLTTGTDHRGAAGLYGPTKARSYGTTIAVADRLSHRVLVFEGGILTTGTFGVPADAVLGQANFTDVGAGASTAGLNHPAGVFVLRDGAGLAIVVADEGNSRVLVFRKPN